ncbi:DUF92 domain-containing protein [Halomarina oriensis]|uniref:DUF92 domain-containing protein n=1 Tax=Halomarina oriensis TaxID=671145 RepID=A0A6B0GN84_9EURY|nr:DUF92 domain-containing protein [Halomarina oriensis]
MSQTVRRAGAFALVSLLALVAPVSPVVVDRLSLPTTVGAAAGVGSVPTTAVVTALPFALVALAAFAVPEDSPAFEWLARPADFEEGRLYGLAGFALAAAALGLVGASFELPTSVYVASVVLLAFGTLAEKGVFELSSDRFAAMTGFAFAAFGAATLAQLVVAVLSPVAFDPPQAVFLAATGGILGALLRSMLYDRDDPLVVITTALVLWLFATLTLELTATQVVVAILISLALGYVSYALETASITGMLTGTLLVFLSVVLGSYGWFAVLLSFFAIGGLSTKFRYDEKLDRGIAEENEGARGSGNVIANSAAALVALLGWAAHGLLGVPQGVFLFAFAGSVAAAMSDTLSSEIGGLYDNPRLITTFRTVPPGTDGGVTWQGGLAGLAGAGIVAAVAFVAFGLSSTGTGLVVLAGVCGMVVDSLLGATVEGSLLDNKGVNFVATTVAGVVGAGLAWALALVPL